MPFDEVLSAPGFERHGRLLDPCLLGQVLEAGENRTRGARGRGAGGGQEAGHGAARHKLLVLQLEQHPLLVAGRRRAARQEARVAELLCLRGVRGGQERGTSSGTVMRPQNSMGRGQR